MIANVSSDGIMEDEDDKTEPTESQKSTVIKWKFPMAGKIFREVIRNFISESNNKQLAKINRNSRDNASTHDKLYSLLKKEIQYSISYQMQGIWNHKAKAFSHFNADTTQLSQTSTLKVTQFSDLYKS